MSNNHKRKLSQISIKSEDNIIYGQHSGKKIIIDRNITDWIDIPPIISDHNKYIAGVLGGTIKREGQDIYSVFLQNVSGIYWLKSVEKYIKDINNIEQHIDVHTGKNIVINKYFINRIKWYNKIPKITNNDIVAYNGIIGGAVYSPRGVLYSILLNDIPGTYWMWDVQSYLVTSHECIYKHCFNKLECIQIKRKDDKHILIIKELYKHMLKKHDAPAIIDLSNYSNVAVSYFISYIYTGMFYTSSLMTPSQTVDDLIDLYKIAEYVDCSEINNIITKATISLLLDKITPELNDEDNQRLSNSQVRENISKIYEIAKILNIPLICDKIEEL